MKTLSARWRWALEPVAGLLFGSYWIIHEAGGLSFAVGTRGYAVAWIGVIAGLAFAICVARVRWELSVVLLWAVVVGQFVVPAARFVDWTWPKYLAIPIATFLIARHVPARSRRAVAWTVALLTVAVGALMCVPGIAAIDFSLPGAATATVEAAIVFVFFSGLTAGAWALGTRLRVRSEQPTNRANEVRAAELSRVLERDHGLVAALSNREREIFLLAARGLTNAEIARESFISEATVKSHIGRILSKLGLVSRVQIVAMAHEHHLLSHQPGPDRF